MSRNRSIEQAYALAHERYASLGVDVGQAIDMLRGVSVSLHCWQGDDVGGFESDAGVTGGGLAVDRATIPGKARDADELRADLEKALRLIPGQHRLNLHACYAETGGNAGRARRAASPSTSPAGSTGPSRSGSGLDFNPTFFSHPKAADGFTLAPSAMTAIRQFWIDHGIACRQDRRGDRPGARLRPA